MTNPVAEGLFEVTPEARDCSGRHAAAVAW